MKTVNDVMSAIDILSDKHLLKSSPENYKRGFAAAALAVYPSDRIAKTLQDKFFIPNDAGYDQDTFLASAVELSVQNHLKRIHTITNFAIDKKVNPPKDVDCYYEVGCIRVSLEIKTPREDALPNGALVLKAAGRVPNHRDEFSRFSDGITQAHPEKEVILGHNKDNTSKDFLTSAHNKFSKRSDADDCNILLIGCGDYFNISEWYMHFKQNEGLFTNTSFWPVTDFELVDLVILSNLKYYHENARQYHDWTLTNVFLLPLLNPKRRNSSNIETLTAGLSVFEHHMSSFDKYKASCEGIPDHIMAAIKVNSYVGEHLTESERKRFFPVSRKEQNESPTS